MPHERQKEAILLLILVLFSVGLAGMLSRQPPVLMRSDLFARWYATQKMATEGRSLYDPQNGRELAAIHGLTYNPVIGRFFYPAYLSILILPIARLPYADAYFVWLVFIQGLMILALWSVYRELRWPQTINRFTAFLLPTLLFIPSLQNMIWAQFNTIAVCGLALTYVALRRGRYFLAGLLATGLTFKPQQMLLTLGFLLLWALFRGERRRFLLGFAAGMSALALFAAAYDPGWVGSFLAGIGDYSGYIRPEPIVNLLGVPGWAFLIAAAVGWAWALIRWRAAGPESPAFAGLLIVSLGIWWLYTPVVGMMHLAALPLAFVLLMAGLKDKNPRLYRAGILAFLLLYILGIAAFVYGLSAPGLYGLHVRLSELAYKLAGPIVLILFALPLFREKGGFPAGLPETHAP